MHRVAVRVLNLHVVLGGRRHLIPAILPVAQYGPVVNGVARPVHWALGVDVRHHAVGSVIGEFAAFERHGREFIAGARQQNTALRRLLVRRRGFPNAVRVCLAVHPLFLLLAREQDDGAIGHGRAGVAPHHARDQAPGSRLRHRRDIGHRHDRVGLDLAVRGFHQIEPLLLGRDRDVGRIPAAGGLVTLLPLGYQLLRVENRYLGIGQNIDGRALGCRVPLSAPGLVGMPRVWRKLRAHQILEAAPPVPFPRAHFLERRLLAAGARRRSLATEPVRLLEFLEERHRIAHAVQAELQGVESRAPHLDRGRLARCKRALRAQ